jgi:hypothetical protein
MSIVNITFGPVEIDGEWFCRLRTPDGQCSVKGPFDTAAQAQEFADQEWPRLQEILATWVATMDGAKIVEVFTTEGEAP